MSASALMHVYEQAIEPERYEAIMSYYRYHALLRTIAERHDVPIDITVAVFSSLSPNNNYIQNLRDTETLLVNEKAGNEIHSFKVFTYHPNKNKAWAIATRVLRPDDAFITLKTWNFYNNVLHPSSEDFVTVDGHMFWAWRGVPGSVKAWRKTQRRKKVAKFDVSTDTYIEIAEDIAGLARAVGLLPNQFQAILWITWKRIHAKHYVYQPDFFPKDYVAAGIIDLDSKDKRGAAITSFRRGLGTESARKMASGLGPFEKTRDLLEDVPYLKGLRPKAVRSPRRHRAASSIVLR
jgi:hypothetical protein